MIDVSISGKIINNLLRSDGNISRIYLASECLSEIGNRKSISEVDKALFDGVKKLTMLGGQKWVRIRMNCLGSKHKPRNMKTD
jgi:hypothetical protein